MDSEGKTITLPGWLDLKVSLGNFLTIATILAAGLISYAKMDSRVSANEAVLAKSELTYMRRDMAEIREASLANQLTDLKAQLDRVERKLDRNSPQ